MIVTSWRVRTGGIADYPPGSSYGPRTLADFEFVWLIAGGGRWVWHDGDDRREHGLHAGTVLLARPGMIDEFRWHPELATRHGYVHFTAPAAGRSTVDLVPADPSTWPVVRRVGGDDPLRPMLRYLVKLHPFRGGDAALAGEVLALLVRMFVAGPLSDPDGGLPAPVLAMAAHVRRVWQAAGGPRLVPLADLADAAAVSSGHLSRIFRARFGVGAAAALELVRLSRAATLLLRSSLSVAAVAAATGFSDPYHFSHRFRRAYGLPPGRYRAAPPNDPAAPLARHGLTALADALH